LLYVWSWEGATDHVGALLEAADRLYQLGRGVDLAWARAEEVDDAALERLVANYVGVFHSPAPEASTGGALQCPIPGSLESLERRFRATRLRETRVDGKRGTAFENAPKPHFRLVCYDRQPAFHVFELLDEREERRSYPIAQRFASKLIQTVRDAAA